jgi:hypothetical protein
MPQWEFRAKGAKYSGEESLAACASRLFRFPAGVIPRFAGLNTVRWHE